MVPRELGDCLMISAIIKGNQSLDNTTKGGTRPHTLQKTMFNSLMKDSSNEGKQKDTSSDVEEEVETTESRADIVVITLDQEDEPKEAEALEGQNQTATSSNGKKDPKADKSRVDKVVVTLDNEEEPKATKKQINIANLKSIRKKKT